MYKKISIMLALMSLILLGGCVKQSCEFEIGDIVYTRQGISPPVENGKVLKVTPRELTTCLILLEEDGKERELDEYWLIKNNSPT